MTGILALITLITLPWGLKLVHDYLRGYDHKKSTVVIGLSSYALVLLTAFCFATFVDIHIEDIPTDSDIVEHKTLKTNAWGTPMSMSIGYTDGSTWRGPVDDDGDPHGEWTYSSRHVPPRYSTQWYHHGEECTKSEFYKWSN